MDNPADRVLKAVPAAAKPPSDPFAALPDKGGSAKGKAPDPNNEIDQAFSQLRGDAALAYGKPSADTLAQEKAKPAGGPRAAAADRMMGDIGAVPRAYIGEFVNKPLSKVTHIPEDDINAIETAGSMAIGARSGMGGAKSAAVKAAETGGAAKTGFNKIFNPAGVSQQAADAAALHRQVLGTRGIQADVETHKLIQHAKDTANLSPQGKLDFLDYVENRSSGAKLANPKLQAAADAIKSVATRYRAAIESVLGQDGPTFIKDYYAHMWKEDLATVEAAISRGGRQGNASNLRARKIPTYSDGIKAGLTPRYDNPIDAMVAYNDNMAKFLGTHDIRDAM